jgi:hypothetical protein
MKMPKTFKEKKSISLLFLKKRMLSNKPQFQVCGLLQDFLTSRGFLSLFVIFGILRFSIYLCPLPNITAFYRLKIIFRCLLYIQLQYSYVNVNVFQAFEVSVQLRGCLEAVCVMVGQKLHLYHISKLLHQI